MKTYLINGNDIRVYTWEEWRNRDLKEKVKAGIVKSKNKSVSLVRKDKKIL